MSGRSAEVMARLAALPADERATLVRSLTADVRLELAERWERGGWAQPGQEAPEGDDWRIWLIRAGRGFGKTRAGAEWVTRIAADPDAMIALVGSTAADVRRVMIEGPSGLRAVAKAGKTPRYTMSHGEVRWPNGARAFVYSADVPDQLRGPEHHAAWCDELAKWRRGDAAWDNLMMGMRRGPHPRVLVTTTPRPTNLMKRVLRARGLVETRGRTRDNPFLPDVFVEHVEDSYGGTALGRQELDGEMIDDLAGALWSRARLEACRCDAPGDLVRVVVGVDPPAGAIEGDGVGDACGIVAVGVDGDGIAHVLADASIAAHSPEAWARAVADCAAQHRADRVVAEANQGGAMVRSVLLAADVALPVKLVRASRGKVARAEPVATLYERGRVRHCGRFAALEDEMCGLVAGGGYQGPGRSPDRADALVWALTELMLGRRGAAGVREL
ncbi:phage terminase large subunit-like protein [Sphingomonas insulae]|uniref:Terminase family protein n=1 Tax=Sphingomonas insulae TaxID=424800 RepID=A0ABP3SZ00_9SPHN|nr:terminase family protein [Sphingomonas insulae]NIJ30390.1 phage terminase large subunit-like protein [Sphingomonas insulae]